MDSPDYNSLYMTYNSLNIVYVLYIVNFFCRTGNGAYILSWHAFREGYITRRQLLDATTLPKALMKRYCLTAINNRILFILPALEKREFLTVYNGITIFGKFLVLFDESPYQCSDNAP